MPTTAPEITVDTTIGQVVTPSTATPTATPTSTTSSTSISSTPTPTVSPTGSAPRPTRLPSPTAQSEPPLPEKLDQPQISQPLYIFGYAPADARVSLNGIGVSGSVMARQDGYFLFNSIYTHTDLYPELCIHATDKDNRVTQPVCIPPIPADNIVPYEVGPVLLSPTLTLSSNNITKGEDAYAAGYSQPNSLVTIYLAKKSMPSLSLVSQAHAYYLPQFVVATDENGYYDFSLPSAESSSYKIFASSKVGNENTSKSNTLTFTVYSQIASIWELIKNLFIGSWISVVIFVQVITVVILVYLLSKSNTGPQARKLKAVAKVINTKVEDIREKYLDYLKKSQNQHI